MNRLVVAVIAIAGVIGALIALGATAQAKAVETVSSASTNDYPAPAARSVGELATRTDWSWLDQDGHRRVPASRYVWASETPVLTH